jgi:16S rRNA processing protein RimM
MRTSCTNILKDLVCVGTIVKPIGVRGAVKIKPHTEAPENFLLYSPVYFETGEEVKLQNVKLVKNGEITANIVGYDDRTAVETICPLNLYVKTSSLPEAGGDYIYFYLLIGMAVIDTDGKDIGTVSAVHNYGAGNFLTVSARPLNGEVSIPYNKTAVWAVDLETRKMIVDPNFVLK